MGLVSMDDAWQACSTDAMEVWAPHQKEAAKVTSETDVGFVARSVKPENKEKQEKSNQRLCSEIYRLRQQLDERDRTQSIVLYASLAVVAILLVVVLQSSWKLQHATDCLLWYSRR